MHYAAHVHREGQHNPTIETIERLARALGMKFEPTFSPA
jgi:DNA-binding phage protein